MTGIKFIVVFTVAAFNLAVMSRSIGTYQLMLYTKLLQCILKQGLLILFALRKTVCKLKSVIRLYTLNSYTAALVPCYKTFGKICR